MIFFTTFAPSEYIHWFVSPESKWEGRPRSVPERIKYDFISVVFHETYSLYSGSHL